ncbi:MAG TPA: hypothetical protein VF344_05630 [Candidatus Limnocylindrales bacterium]
MTTAGGPNRGGDAALLSRERDHVLKTLGDDALSGPAILRRMTGRPTEPGDQRLLYPALHSLEAGWALRAEWVTDTGGRRRRTYRRRRLPLLPSRTSRS